jgi:hypothetical protein
MRTIFFIVGLFLCIFTFPVEMGAMAIVFAVCVAFTLLMGYKVFTRAPRKQPYKADPEAASTFLGSL